MAVTRSTRSDQVCDGSRWAITSRRTGSGERLGCQRDGPDPLPLLGHRAVRVRDGLQEKLDDGVDAIARIDFGGAFLDLAFEQVLEAAATADLRRDRRTGRGAHQHVGIQQRPSRGRRLVGDAAQNACLPGDSRYSPATEHQRLFGRHVAAVCCAACAVAFRSAGRSWCRGGSGNTTSLVICSAESTWTSSPGAT